MKTSYLVIIMVLVFSIGLTLGSNKGDAAPSAQTQIDTVSPALSGDVITSNAAGFQMKNNSKSFASDSDYALVNFPGHNGYYAVYVPR